MAYRTVLFDLDHTLLDSDTSAERAFVDAMAAVGHDVDDHLATHFATINLGLWARVEEGELSPNDVRAVRFATLFDEAGIDADPSVAGDRYVTALGEHGEFYPGTEAALDRLAAQATLGLVTNGIGEVQRARIDRLDLRRWFTSFTISGEVGIAKPNPTIFDLAFDELGEPDRSSALMVGDSLSSDMAGASAAGIDSAWFDRTGRSADGVPVTYRIEALADLIPIVMGEPTGA